MLKDQKPLTVILLKHVNELDANSCILFIVSISSTLQAWIPCLCGDKNMQNICCNSLSIKGSRNIKSTTSRIFFKQTHGDRERPITLKHQKNNIWLNL